MKDIAGFWTPSSTFVQVPVDIHRQALVALKIEGTGSAVLLGADIEEHLSREQVMAVYLTMVIRNLNVGGDFMYPKPTDSHVPCTHF